MTQFMFNPLEASRVQQARQSYGLQQVQPVSPTPGFNFTGMPAMPGQANYNPSTVMNGGVPVQSQTSAAPWGASQVPQVSNVSTSGASVQPSWQPIGPQQTTQAAPQIGGTEIGPSRDLMNSPAGGGWFDNWDMQGVAQGVSAATGLAQAYLGFQGLSDARDLASQAQINWDKNFAMQTDAYETNKANQARTRASLNA